MARVSTAWCAGATSARVTEAYDYDKRKTVNSFVSQGSLPNATDGTVTLERCPGQRRSAIGEDLKLYTIRQLSGPDSAGLAPPGCHCRPAPAVGQGHRGSPGVLSACVTIDKGFGHLPPWVVEPSVAHDTYI